jgi:hypothetical protein
MVNILGTIMIGGTVLLNGHGVDNQVIMLLSKDMNRFLSSTVTNSDGSYSLKLSTKDMVDSSVVIVAKIQYPVLALAYHIVTLKEQMPQQDFNFDTSSEDFFSLKGEIIAEKLEMPPFIELSITPISFDGIPSPIEKFFIRRSERVVDASYYETKVENQSFEIKVQRGCYRIAGSYIIYKHPDINLSKRPNFVVGKIIEVDKRIPLTGEPLGGYKLNVHNNQKIKMYLEVFSGN